MQDATVQSIPQMSQAPSVAPSSYVVPAQSAPAPSYQAAPVPYQVGMSYPQAVPQAAPSYQSPPTPYAPQYQPADKSQSYSAGNPWESAFNKVVNLLSAPSNPRSRVNPQHRLLSTPRRTTDKSAAQLRNNRLRRLGLTTRHTRPALPQLT